MEEGLAKEKQHNLNLGIGCVCAQKALILLLPAS